MSMQGPSQIVKLLVFGPYTVNLTENHDGVVVKTNLMTELNMQSLGEAMQRTIEAVIIGHHGAGVDIMTEAYVEGLESAYERLVAKSSEASNDDEHDGGLAARIADAILEALEPTINLGYVDPGDALTPEDVQAVLRGPAGMDAVRANIEDAFEESLNEDAKAHLRIIAGDLGLDFNAVERNAIELADLLRIARERDRSDVLDALAKQTGPMLLRYRVREDWADFPVQQDSWRYDEARTTNEARALADMFGVPFEGYQEQMIELVANATYGGSPEIIWYGKPGDLIQHLETDNGKTWSVRGTLTFTDPYLLVIDNLNGSGHDCRIEGITLTVPFDPSRIVVDAAKGSGYGWDAIAAVVKSAYATNVVWTPEAGVSAAAAT